MYLLEILAIGVGVITLGGIAFSTLYCSYNIIQCCIYRKRNRSMKKLLAYMDVKDDSIEMISMTNK